eukprot:6002931-Prymnesium_polylepis.1
MAVRFPEHVSGRAAWARLALGPCPWPCFSNRDKRAVYDALSTIWSPSAPHLTTSPLAHSRK